MEYLAFIAIGVLAGIQWGQGWPLKIPHDNAWTPAVVGMASFLVVGFDPWWLMAAVGVGFYLHRFPGPGLGFPKLGETIPEGRANWRSDLVSKIVTPWRTVDATWRDTRLGAALYHVLRAAYVVPFLIALSLCPSTDLGLYGALIVFLAGAGYQFIDGTGRGKWTSYFAEGWHGGTYAAAVAVMAG